jgi:hypothetical protein
MTIAPDDPPGSARTLAPRERAHLEARARALWPCDASRQPTDAYDLLPTTSRYS